jgi:hypothetical protein
MPPVRYGLGLYIPESYNVHSYSREILKFYLDHKFLLRNPSFKKISFKIRVLTESEMVQVNHHYCFHAPSSRVIYRDVDSVWKTGLISFAYNHNKLLLLKISSSTIFPTDFRLTLQLGISLQLTLELLSS